MQENFPFCNGSGYVFAWRFFSSSHIYGNHREARLREGKSKCSIKNELNYLQINAIVSGTETHVIDSGNLSYMIYVRCWRKETERGCRE